VPSLRLLDDMYRRNQFAEKATFDHPELCIPGIRFFLKTLTLPASADRAPSMRSVIVPLLSTHRTSFLDRGTLQLEILALRHQLHVLERTRAKHP
jgi:hypothetical protein